MPSLPSQIMSHAVDSPDGTLLCPSALLHLGNRAAVDQALSRLARKGNLIRVCQGVYVRPIQTRFGPSLPAVEKVLASLSTLWGETIVPCGGMAANALGLTTQVPIRSVYLTSGSNRKLTLGEQRIDLRHAPRWQLVAPYRPAGDAIRALAWLGSKNVQESLRHIEQRLSTADFDELAASRAVMPAWIAEPVSVLVADGGRDTSTDSGDMGAWAEDVVDGNGSPVWKKAHV